ncbi:response regulator [Actinomyces howellii]|uniref:Response regulator protein vraR n=1 Tax=Actinomyces howellii TaxID=52771 RepID=A0A3S4R0R9_9ACTO|nr:response regulator transcription factor [Actinomyces howellii]VEG27972.1 Response regulator protein vraR [Actinomyces howellii]
MRLLIVDDHPVVRSGLVGMLGAAADIELVGQAADGAEAVRLARELDPDVVLMDLRMPVLDGVEATRLIAGWEPVERDKDGAGPAPRVVVLTTYDSDEDILPAVEAGAIGYVLKDSVREEILDAVRAAAMGRGVLSPRVTRRLVKAARGEGGERREVPMSLSPREREILEAVSRGLPNSQIAIELCIAETTVKTYLVRAFNKLGVDSRAAAVARALRYGMLDPR